MTQVLANHPEYFCVPNHILGDICCGYTPAEIKILLFLFRYSYCHGNTKDSASVKEMMEATKLSKETILQALRLLESKDLIKTNLADAVMRIDVVACINHDEIKDGVWMASQKQ